jgi:hypothetical protein
MKKYAKKFKRHKIVLKMIQLLKIITFKFFVLDSSVMIRQVNVEKAHLG